MAMQVPFGTDRETTLGFPLMVAQTPKVVVQTYYFANFLSKTV